MKGYSYISYGSSHNRLDMKYIIDIIYIISKNNMCSHGRCGMDVLQLYVGGVSARILKEETRSWKTMEERNRYIKEVTHSLMASLDNSERMVGGRHIPTASIALCILLPLSV